MGRPAKTICQHRLEGTYRPDRHGERLDGLAPVGKPKKPPGLSESERKMWNFVVRSLPSGVLSAADTFVLIGAVRWFCRWSRLMGVGDYKATCQAAAAWKGFMSAAGQLGLSPQSRAKIKAPMAPIKDPMSDLLRSIAENN